MKALATGTKVLHQNMNDRDTAVLLHMLSLLPYNTIVRYPNNHRLFIQQKTYSCTKMFVYTRAGPAQCYAKPNSNPNPNQNLSPVSARAVLLPREAAIVLPEMTEMRVAAHAQTRCRIFRLWDYQCGCRTG